jgi:subtilisin-like proprotein convertase family protein
VGVSPASLSFGDQANGTTSAPQAFTISNNGDTGQALQITSIMKTGTNSGDFTVTDDPSPVSIPSGGSVTVHVTFTPASTGSKLAIMTINNNDAANPSPTVSLSGSGIVPEPTVQFAAASFTEDESQTMVVTVTRAGDTTGTSSVQYSMSDGSAWGGASCSTFDYIASAGTLSFASGETQRTISIPLCADWIAEGTQDFSVALSSPTGAALGTQSTATANINDTASQFRNTASIFVGASSSPSTIDVTGAPASIGRIRVTLFDLSFPTPDDIDVLLVGPGGQQILLMADAGGSNSVNSSTLTFSDAAGQVLPDTGQIASGSYEPTSWGIGAEPDFPAPAPVGPYNEPGGTIGGTTTLATVFNGTNGDGTWKLYIRNDLGGDLSPSGVAGQFQGGWGIELLAPTAAPVSISGRITDANGYGIGNVIVRLEGGDLLQPVVFQTGPFGYYSFDGLNPGFTYVVSVAAKRHVFADPIRVVTVNDNVSEVNFTAQPLE